MGNPLLEPFCDITRQFRKMLKDVEKIIKISDNQQEYLQMTKNNLKKEIEERVKVEKRLKYLATTDTLTGIYNRGTELAILDSHIKAWERNKEIFSICYIDINGLKYVNDNFGHLEGDELLVLTCKIIKESICDCDILSRLGGDEFMIIFPQCDKHNADVAMERIILNIAQENSRNLKPYQISISYGAIQMDSSNGKRNIDELIEMADRKMYENKRNNKKVNQQK